MSLKHKLFTVMCCFHHRLQLEINDKSTPVVACSYRSCYTVNELGVMLGGNLLELLGMGKRWCCQPAQSSTHGFYNHHILGSQELKVVTYHMRCLQLLPIALTSRTATVFISHIMDGRAEAADIAGVDGTSSVWPPRSPGICYPCPPLALDFASLRLV